MLNTNNYMQTERTDDKVKIVFWHTEMGKRRGPQFLSCPCSLPQTTKHTKWRTSLIISLKPSTPFSAVFPPLSSGPKPSSSGCLASPRRQVFACFLEPTPSSVKGSQPTHGILGHVCPRLAGFGLGKLDGSSVYDRP